MPQEIAFQGVSVQYHRAQRLALKTIDLTIARGERIALVGESGAGKSTLIDLMLGFVAPSNGRILLDDTPLGDLDICAWRRHCAWIGQNAMLVTGTLAENIAMARPDATTGQIESAARRAGVLEFAHRWDSGLETMVGEQGGGLSVGQAQRVALARAFIKDAPLLLLDEPTASLDKTTEAEIIAGLAAWSEGRTLLIATHRPAALAIADRIIVLAAGEIIAQGDYQTLKRKQRELLPKY